MQVNAYSFRPHMLRSSRNVLFVATVLIVASTNYSLAATVTATQAEIDFATTIAGAGVGGGGTTQDAEVVVVPPVGSTNSHTQLNTAAGRTGTISLGLTSSFGSLLGGSVTGGIGTNDALSISYTNPGTASIATLATFSNPATATGGIGAPSGWIYEFTVTSGTAAFQIDSFSFTPTLTGIANVGSFGFDIVITDGVGGSLGAGYSNNLARGITNAAAVSTFGNAGPTAWQSLGLTVGNTYRAMILPVYAATGQASYSAAIDDVTFNWSLQDLNTPPIAVAGAGPPDSNFGGPIGPVLSVNLNGSGSSDNEQSAASLNYLWTVPGEANQVGINPALSLADSGLTHPGDSTTITLRVTDNGGLFNETTVNVGYTNNAPVAGAGTDLAFNSSMSSQNTNGTTTDLDLAANATVPGFEALSYTWSHNGATTANTSITFAQAVAAGMVNTTSSGSINLSVLDNGGTSAGAATNRLGSTDNLLVTYNNAAPDAATASVVDGVGGKTFNASLTDVDLSVNNMNGAGPNFEYVDWEFDNASDGYGGGFASGQLLANGNPSQFITNAIIAAQFGGPGVKTGYFTVRDRAGLTDTFTFTFQIAAIPEPMTLAIWSVFGLAAIGFAVRHKRK